MSRPTARDDLEADRALLQRTFEVRRGRERSPTRCRWCLATWWIGPQEIREGVTLQLLEHARAHQREGV